MREVRGGNEREKPSSYTPFSEKEKESLRRALVDEMREVKKSRRKDPNVYQFIIELVGIVHEVRQMRLPEDIPSAKLFVQGFQEIRNGIMHLNDLFLQEEEREIKEFFDGKIQEALQRARETNIYFLQQEASSAPAPLIKERLAREIEQIVADIHKDAEFTKKIKSPPRQKFTDGKSNLPPPLPNGSESRGGLTIQARQKEPTTPPPAEEPTKDSSAANQPQPESIQNVPDYASVLASTIRRRGEHEDLVRRMDAATPSKGILPDGGPISGEEVKESTGDLAEYEIPLDEYNARMEDFRKEDEAKKRKDAELTHKNAEYLAARKAQRAARKPTPLVESAKVPSASMPSTGGWRKKALVGVAALAGFFGVKLGFEKAEEVAKENIEAASDVPDVYSGRIEARITEADRVPLDQQPSEPSDAEDGKEPLTHTYTVQSGDSPWRLADSILESAGIDDPDGTLTLKAVKGLREKNNIQGDAARSKSMWVGQTLDLSPVYDLIASVKDPSSAPEAVGTKSVPSSKASLGSSTASPDTAHAQISPELAQNFSPDLLSPSLTHFGETVFSRSHNMLTHIDVKPNVAKSAVLSAIVLKDSHKTEAEAYRVKYAGHKKFDVTKDTLDFTRAAQAALDLKAGMSPGDVAKKYGVANVYSKLRDR